MQAFLASSSGRDGSAPPYLCAASTALWTAATRPLAYQWLSRTGGRHGPIIIELKFILATGRLLVLVALSMSRSGFWTLSWRRARLAHLEHDLHGQPFAATAILPLVEDFVTLALPWQLVAMPLSEVPFVRACVLR